MNEELQLFVEKAYRLKISNFAKWATTIKNQSDFEKIIAGDWLAHDGLSIDELDAFCLNLRLLIQPRDNISIWQIMDMSKKWTDDCAKFRDDIELSASKLDKELCKRSLVQIHKDQITYNKDLFEIIFYGGITHLNPDKHRLFKKITSSGLFSFFVFQAFLEVIFCYMNCIQQIAFNVVQYSQSNNQ